MAHRNRLMANGSSSPLLDGLEDSEQCSNNRSANKQNKDNALFNSPSRANKKNKNSALINSPTRPSKKSEAWKPLLRLFIAPALAILLSVVCRPDYVTLAIIYFLTSAKPVLYFVYDGKLPKMFQYNGSSSSTRISNDNNMNDGGGGSFNRSTFLQYVDSTVAMHKSLSVQFAVLIGFIWVYKMTTANCGGDKNVHEAFSNAHSIIQIENYLGIDIEPKWQKALLGHKILMTFLSQWYISSHFVIPTFTAGWLMFTGKDINYKFRGSFALVLVCAMIGYWFIPTMPPRLLRRYANTYPDKYNTDDVVMEQWLGMIDSLNEEESAYDKLHSEIGNPYAAMPSMHTGWAWWSTLSIWDGISMPDTKQNWSPKFRQTIWYLAFAHPPLIMFATIVTANHYVLDLVAGCACVIVGRRLADLIFVQKIFHHGYSKTINYTTINTKKKDELPR